MHTDTITYETTGCADEDTKESCRSLTKCMRLREKYLSVHPFPPQDKVAHFQQVL